MAKKKNRRPSSPKPPIETPDNNDLAVFDPGADLGEPVRDFSPTGVPDPNRRLGRSGPVWFLFGLILTVIFLIGIFIFNPTQVDAPPLQATAGVAGGVAVPSPTPVLPTPTPVPPTPTPVPILEPGAQVRVANTDGQGIRLRADASTESITYEIVNEGDLFEVLEPSNDYESYPVEAEGYQWVRIQGEDGLTGWTIRDYLAPVQ